MKKAINVFDIIEEVNKDLGMDLFVAYIFDDNYSVYAMVTEARFAYSSIHRQVGNKYETFTDKNKIEDIKKKILSMVCYSISSANPYDVFIKKARDTIAKKKSVFKTLDYLNERYGIKFRGYANMGSEFLCYVVSPDLNCSWMNMFKCSHYFSLYFDKNNNISEKSLKAYCRKMDIIIERMKCINAAFGNEEFLYHGKNFYFFCDIKKSRDGEWIVKFPYMFLKNGKRIYGKFYGKDLSIIHKIMELYHYKDTDFCIWKGKTPGEFEMVRELIK